MYYNLFLDDERVPKDVKWQELPPVQWIIVRDFDRFCSIIKENGLPNYVSFDHDLGDTAYKQATTGIFDYSKQGNEKTGYDCVKWLIEYCMDNSIKFPNYTVHSLNPVGKENIIKLIESYKIAVENTSDI